MDATRIAALTSLGMQWQHVHKTSNRPIVESSSDSGTEEDELPMITSQKRMSSESAGTTAQGGSFPSHENAGDRKSAPEDKSWEANLRRLTRFKATKGHLRVTVFNDRALFIWINRQRQLYRNKGLRPSRINSLEAVGFDWKDAKTRRAGNSSSEDGDADKAAASQAEDRSKSGEEGTEDEPMADAKVETKPEPAVAMVVRDSESTEYSEVAAVVVQESESTNGETATRQPDVTAVKAEAEETLTPAVVFTNKSEPGPNDSSSSSVEVKSSEQTKYNEKEDESPPFVLDPGVFESNPRDRMWNLHFCNLQKYKRVHGTDRVSRTIDYNLQEWVSRQRMVYHGHKNGDLNPNRLNALNRIGFVWSAGKSPAKSKSQASSREGSIADASNNSA